MDQMSPLITWVMEVEWDRWNYIFVKIRELETCKAGKVECVLVLEVPLMKLSTSHLDINKKDDN